MQSDLADAVMLAGAGIGYRLPTAGACIIDDANAFSAEIMRIAERNPAFAKMLMRASDLGTPLRVGRYVGRWGVAGAVDVGALKPDSQTAQIFGVDEKFDELVERGVIDLEAREQARADREARKAEQAAEREAAAAAADLALVPDQASA